VFVLFAGLPGQPESPVAPDSLNMAALSRWDRGAAENVAMQDSLTYVGSGTSVLVVRDSSVVFAAQLPGECEALVADSSHLYAASGKAGLAVLTLGDPARPRLLAALKIPGYALSVARFGSLAALACADCGVSLVDLSDPARPRLLSSFVPAESALAVTVAGNDLYVACGSAGVAVLDVSRPESPVVSYRLATPTPAYGLARRDTVVYALCGDSGALILNAANPHQPPQPVRMNWRGALAMQVHGNLAAVACGWYGLWLVDVGNPAQPLAIRYLPLGAYAQDVALGEGLMSVAIAGGGVLRYDISQPARPVFLGRNPVPGYTADVAADGDTAWALLTDGLHCVDLSRNPAAELGFCRLSSAGSAVALGAGTAAVALGTAGLTIVSTKDPRQPSVGATLTIPGSALSVAAQDSWIFIGTQDSGIYVVALDSARRPSIAGHVRFLAPVMGLSVKGNVLAAAAGNAGLCLVDVSDPRAPIVPVPPIFLGWTRGVSVAGGWTAACGSFGLCLLSTGNITQPQVRFQSPLIAQAWDVALADTLCFVATDWAGVVAFDIKDTPNVSVRGYYPGATLATDVAAAGDRAVMADVCSGLTLLRLKPAAAVHEPILPGYGIRVLLPPVSAPPSIVVQAQPQVVPASVSLLDPAGRVLGRVGLSQAGTWQQADFPAFPLGAGTYFVRVQSGAETRVLRTQLIR
jgi:hypothetical protein